MQSITPVKRHLFWARPLQYIIIGLIWAAAFGVCADNANTNWLTAWRNAVQGARPDWNAPPPLIAAQTTNHPQAAAVAAKLRNLIHPGGQLQTAISPPQTALPAAAQIKAFEQLRQKAGDEVEVHFRPNNQTIMQIRGKGLEEKPRGVVKANESELSETIVRNFLSRHRDLLQLEDPQQELRLIRRERDEIGHRHFRFEQYYSDLPVWPSGLSAHLDGSGDLQMVDGAYVPTPKMVDTQPALGAADAAQLAKTSVPGGQQGAVAENILIIYAPLDRPPRLAWKLLLQIDIQHVWQILVDAKDGRILNRINQCPDSNVVGSSLGLDNKTYSVNAWSAGGKYYLADTTKHMYNASFDPINDPHGVITIYDAHQLTEDQLKTGNILRIESQNVNTWLPDAVSAAVNFGFTYDYFWERLNRNSINGEGGNIKAVVRVGGMDNAFWSFSEKAMYFGDVRPYAASLDVVGHELTHGVVQFSAGLVYEMQSGALNESFSDIFGEMAEARRTGQPDWKLGSGLDFVLRDFINPGTRQYGGKPYPSKMSEFFDLPNSNETDHGGVHINSSIINHAFYLLAEGLPGAIGLVDAEKIFYRCLTVHLQNQSQFQDARLGCIASAEELFGAGSPQAYKVAEAFDAVEITGGLPTPPPAPIPEVQGPDSTLFVSIDPNVQAYALSRYEAAQGDPPGGVALVDYVLTRRPAVSGDGSFAMFVDAANDLCGVETDDPGSLQCLGFEGLVHSVAISPDSRYYAFVLRDPLTGQADNQINVYDLLQDTNHTYVLEAPMGDGPSVDTVLFADSMVFTTDSKQLIYDALTVVKFAGEPVERWSIYKLDLATETITVLVPPFEEADIGNPNLGRVSNRYLTMDALVSNGFNAIINLDLFTGDAGLIGITGTNYGFPCFTGDESAVIYTVPDATAPLTGFSLVKQPLSTNRLETNGPPSLWLADATLGMIYRRGDFVSSNAPPVVTLTSPSNNASFTAPATVTLAAQASDPDGSVFKVEFYNHDEKIGESTAAPYQFAWNNVPAGEHRLTARAIDNLGAAADSPLVSVTVTTGNTGGVNVKLASPQRMPDGSIQFTITSERTRIAIVEVSTDLKQWTPLLTITSGPEGYLFKDDQTMGSAQRFYRVKETP